MNRCEIEYSLTVPGDECQPSGDHCIYIEYAFCNADTQQCSCDAVHQEEDSKCVLIPCTFTSSVACDGITNGICTNSMCSCLSSAIIDQETGQCKNRVLGDDCAKGDHCSGVTGGKCDSVNQTMQCVCTEQYKQNGNICIPKEPGDSCVPNENHCSLISGQVFCKSETGVCTCADTYTDDNDRCVPKACSSSADCSQNAECNSGICSCLITADLIQQTGSCVQKEQGMLYLYTAEVVVAQTVDDDQHTAFINDQEIHTTNIVSSADASVSSILKDMELHSLSSDAFKFGSKINCSVTAFNDSGKNELKTVTSTSLTLFEASTTNLLFNRGRTATFSVIQNVPFGCGSSNHSDCFLQYIVYDPDDSYDCTDSTLAILHSDTCGGRIDGITQGDINTNVWHKQVTTITVHIQENVITGQPHCYSHVDPHHGTFDNLLRENTQTYKIFKAVCFAYCSKYTFLNFIYIKQEGKLQDMLISNVQMVTEPCGRWGAIPTCACAVTMKSGGDIFTLNHCGGHLTKYLSNLDGTLKVYREHSTNYKVVFNTGMIVSIYVMTWGKYVLNIDIYPSPDDFGQVEGLCGNFNGDPTDDLAYRDTGDLWVPTDSNDRVWSWAVYPDSFSFSWELKGKPEDSLLSENNYLYPSLWNSKTKYCVCPDAANGNYDSICTFHSDDSCKTPVVRKGEIISAASSGGRGSNRRKRSNPTTTKVNKRLQEMRRQWHETFENVQRMKRNTIDGSSSNMTTKEAVQFCTNAFMDCPTAISTNETEAGLNKTIQECAADVLSTGQSQWVVYHCDATTQSLEMKIEKDETFVETYPEIVHAVRNNACPSNCSSNGQCIKGVCNCFDGYGTDLCMLALSVPPILNEAGYEGTCDLDSDDCSCLSIVGNGFVVHATCNIVHYKADITGIFSRFDEYTLPCSYLDLNEVCAPVKEAENRRRKRSDGNGTDVTSGFSEMFELSVSNDGSHFSIPSSVVILDTTCQETSVDLMGTTMVTLKVCIIPDTQKEWTKLRSFVNLVAL
ncbi:VWDE-like protein [Mya arenaria]|uniref:VWDE-like protein n=1 Tax=Mya arenaria TaxID=6604 RepID=A0ABY7E024_MYAAR|nr:VWDE-like protein [Mya arenaria]